MDGELSVICMKEVVKENGRDKISESDSVENNKLCRFVLCCLDEPIITV